MLNILASHYQIMGRTVLSTAIVLIGLVLGIITAINAMGSVGLMPIAAAPLWSEWQLGPNDSMLVYSLGHFLGEGQLPPPKSTHYFVRSADEDGNSLRTDCIYVVEGKLSPARWWTMSVALPGTAAPHSELTAGEAVLAQDGVLKMTISAHPMPGNWIVPPDGNSISLYFIVNEPTPGQHMLLPTVTKSGC